MKPTHLQMVFDWALLSLIVGTVMFLGKIRMHQTNLNEYLLVSFGVILLLLVLYRLIYRKWILPKQ